MSGFTGAVQSHRVGKRGRRLALSEDSIQVAAKSLAVDSGLTGLRMTP
jgi:hypothetical protein